MSTAASNDEAQAFKALHVPGKPLLLVNVNDIASAKLISSMPQCKALATASFSIALAHGVEDPDLTLEMNLETVAKVAKVARAAGKPLTVDLQDGYGDQLEEAVKTLINMGVVGINLEDSLIRENRMMDEATAIDRIKRVMSVANAAGVPDFVINARSDTYFKGGTIEESIRRGKLYLEAGATTIFIFRTVGLGREEVQKVVQGLGGMVNISQRLPIPGAPTPPLTAAEIAELGAARISIGPQLHYAAMAGMKKAAQDVFGTPFASM